MDNVELRELLDSLENDMSVNLFILEWMAKRMERNHKEAGVQSTITKMTYDFLDKNMYLDVQIIPEKPVEWIDIKLVV